MSEKREYYYEIDILRGLACLIVFIGHFPMHRILGLTSNFVYAPTGVYLFFVISGFIISKTFQSTPIVRANSFTWNAWYTAFLENRNHIYSFWYRRFWRLFPALCLLFCCVFILVIRAGIRDHDLYLHISAFFRFISNFVFLDNSVCDNNLAVFPSIFQALCVGIVWTLTCEIFFYLIFPLVILLPKSPKILPQLFAATVGIKILFLSFGWEVYFREVYFVSIAHLDLFLGGVSIAIYYTKIGKLNNIVMLILTFCSLYFLTINDTGLAIATQPNMYIKHLFSAMFLVYIGSLQLKTLDLPIVGRSLHFIGTRSYFIYLMHFVTDFITRKPFAYLATNSDQLQHLLQKGSETFDRVRHISTFIAVVVLSDLFHRFVEKPVAKKYKKAYSS